MAEGTIIELLLLVAVILASVPLVAVLVASGGNIAGVDGECRGGNGG